MALDYNLVTRQMAFFLNPFKYRIQCKLTGETKGSFLRKVFIY